jgi:hypothetical protein
MAVRTLLSYSCVKEKEREEEWVCMCTDWLSDSILYSILCARCACVHVCERERQRVNLSYRIFSVICVLHVHVCLSVCVCV